MCRARQSRAPAAAPSCSSFVAPRWPSMAFGMRSTWASRLRRTSRPLSVIATSTTRRSWRPRTRVTRPRRLRRSIEPRDVGVARDHPVGDVAARQPGRMAPAQNAQHVVLVGRQFGGGLEELLPRLHDARGRDPQAQEDLLLARGERALLLQFPSDDSSHGRDNSRFNDYRQEEYVETHVVDPPVGQSTPSAGEYRQLSRRGGQSDRTLTDR